MEFITNFLTPYLPTLFLILQGIGALTVLATIIVRFTPTTKDDEALSKAMAYWLKVVRWLPTIGINPQTKLLEAQLETLKPKA